MIDNYDNVPKNSKENAEEIYNEIIMMLQSENTDVFLNQKNVLAERLKNLIALGSVLANQQGQDIATCVKDCLKTGATQEQIIQVLQLAILIAEIPVKKYTEIVQAALQFFEDRPWQ